MSTITTKDSTQIYCKGMYSAKRIIIFLCGVISLTVAIIGIVLPLLPTTPFIILAAVCFAKSSVKAHRWLLTNRWCGEYIQNYREKKGISLRHKILTLSLLWATIGYSVFFVAERLWLQLLLIAVASGVTAHIISITTCKSKAKALILEKTQDQIVRGITSDIGALGSSHVKTRQERDPEGLPGWLARHRRHTQRPA